MTTPVANAPTLRAVQAQALALRDRSKAFILEPLGGDPTVGSAIAVADPVPG